MNRLFEIASELGNIARERVSLREFISVCERSITAREMTIIPDGGWPGKNADERKVAEVTTKSNDEQLGYLVFDKRIYEDELAKLDAAREGLIEERDAIRWTIRDNEVVSLGGLSTFGAPSEKENANETELPY